MSMSEVLPDPSLRIHTVYFHKDDRDYCRAVGESLYGLLTRPLEDSLAEGPAIWVSVAESFQHVESAVPGVDVFIAVLGPGAASGAGGRRSAVAWISQMHERLQDRRRIVAVLQGSLWPIFENELRRVAHPLRAPRQGDRPARLAALRYELIKAIFRLAAASARVLISFETHDGVCRSIAEAIKQAVTAGVVGGTADQPWVAHMSHDRGALDVSRTGGAAPIFVGVRGAMADVRSQRELLAAKLEQLPIVLVDATDEERSYARVEPHSVNVMRLPWSGRAEPIVEAALVEWLRDYHFREASDRLGALVAIATGDDAALSAVEVRSRRPELLDVAGWWRTRTGQQTIMHPDPELALHDREVLLAAYPRLRLVTPSSAYRGRRGGSEFPLVGYEVALSISDGPDLGGVTGMTYEHLLDANHGVARTLLSSGASLAYAGDFRRQGHAERLWELISAYNQTSTRSADLLLSYLGAHVAVPKRYPVRVRSMREDDDLRSQAVLSFDPALPRWLYLSDLRRVMAVATSARFAMGGNSLPLGSDPRPLGGYRGPMPGVVEEVMRSLEVPSGRPVYLAGGFGGATRLAVQALKGEPVPQLEVETFKGNERFMGLTERLRTAAGDYPSLGLPPSLDALWARLVELGKRRFATDEAATDHNGLTRAENMALWTTKDPAVVSALIMRGLLNLAPRTKALNWTVELVAGDWTTAHRLDVCLILAPSEDLERWRQMTSEDPETGLAPAPPSIDCEWVAYMDTEPAIDPARQIAAGVERLAAVAGHREFTRVGISVSSAQTGVDWRELPGIIKAAFSPLTTVVVHDPVPTRLARLQAAVEAAGQMTAIRARALLSLTEGNRQFG